MLREVVYARAWPAGDPRSFRRNLVTSLGDPSGRRAHESPRHITPGPRGGGVLASKRVKFRPRLRASNPAGSRAPGAAYSGAIDRGLGGRAE